MADRTIVIDLSLGILGALILGYFINSNATVTTSQSDSFDDVNDGSADAYGAASSLTAWAGAISNFENVNPAYNNPGGVNEQGDAGKTPNGIAMYSTWQVGYNRLLTLLQNMVNKNPSMTLDAATRYYAFGNATNLNASQAQVLANYQSSVAQTLGVDGSTPIGLIGG